MSKYRKRERSDAQDVLEEFEDWLLRERSVRETTARVYVDQIVGFIGWLPAPVEESLRSLTPGAILEWVDHAARQGLKPSTLRKQLVMLRSFLRFCHRTGRASADFSAVVPHAAGWRLSTIPDPVPEGTIQTLLDSLDLQAPKGLRDRAILLLLTGLGLRAGEIAALRLTDIGWRTGTLRIRGKGDRADELPLPEEVGRALEDYVVHGRGGRAGYDEVFLTMFEPVRPVASNGISKIIPAKRTKTTIVSFLTRTEAEALIAAPDTTTWTGRRDRLLLHLGIQTGLRVSELIGLRVVDVEIGPHSQLRCLGKGRKHRVIPLQKPAVRLLNAWLAESGTTPTAPLFPTSRGTPLSRAAVAKLLARHVTVASGRCPSLRGKNVTPHTLRHTCAMMLLHAGIDTASIALWLGHATIQTTQAYLHADLELKRRSLDRLAPIGDHPPARYQASDALIAFLTDR